MRTQPEKHNTQEPKWPSGRSILHFKKQKTIEFLYWSPISRHAVAGHGACPEKWLRYQMRLHLQKSFFPLQEVSVSDNLLIRGGSTCTPPHWALKACGTWACACCLNLFELIRPVVSGRFWVYGVNHTYDSYNLSNSSSSLSLELWEEGIDEDILARTECSKVSQPIHIVQLWNSVFWFPICLKKFL